MEPRSAPVGRRERAMADKRRRIMDAARSLFAERGIDGVTTQEIADDADVAVGTLFRYAASKAELLIMVQNEKFATAIDDGLRRVADLDTSTTCGTEVVMTLLTPVIVCVREHPENGRTYLHELVFGDPAEPHRTAGLAQAWRLETAVSEILQSSPRRDPESAATLARVVSSIIHVTATATQHLHESPAEILSAIRAQVTEILAETRTDASTTSRGESPPEAPVLTSSSTPVASVRTTTEGPRRFGPR